MSWLIFELLTVASIAFRVYLMVAWSYQIQHSHGQGGFLDLFSNCNSIGFLPVHGSKDLQIEASPPRIGTTINVSIVSKYAAINVNLVSCWDSGSSKPRSSGSTLGDINTMEDRIRTIIERCWALFAIQWVFHKTWFPYQEVRPVCMVKISGPIGTRERVK